MGRAGYALIVFPLVASAAVTAGAKLGDATGLTLSVYDNTAATGDPVRTTLLETPDFTFSAAQSTGAFSAEVTGTILVSGSGTFEFDCDFSTAVLGLLHVDGHLVCETGVNSPSGTVAKVDQPLPVLSKKELPILMHVMFNASVGIGAMRSFDVTVHNKDVNFTLSPSLSQPEQQRRELQRELAAAGWGLYHQMDFAKHVRLPEGQVVAFHLCDLRDGTCTGAVRQHDDNSPDFRLGYHAVDRSYGRMHLAAGGCNVSLAFGGGEHLLVHVVPANDSSSDCEHHAAVATGLGAWYRDVQVDLDPTGQVLQFASTGLRAATVRSTRPLNASLDALLATSVTALPHVAASLAGGGGLGLSSDPDVASDADLKARLAAAAHAEDARYAAYAELAETKAAVQAAVMWLTIYNPVEQGPISNIIRGNPFSLDVDYVNDDWAYVIFDWDNTFAAYMLSFDSRELGYSALIQLVKSKTPDGFIPNWATPQHKRRWSQPPIAGRVLLEMYKKFNESWLPRLLFDDLLDWNRWFHAERILAPLNITCLGGPDGGSQGMQEGRWESGMDNSPMYDDWPGDFKDGKMQLYDVGMASLHVMDTDALATLANALGRPEERELRARADAMRTNIVEHLWDAEHSVYTNLLPNGTFLQRYSPTSFYPLLTAGPPAEHVDATVRGWLMNATRFCVSPAGDFAGNSDECWWGLPSISADDPAFPQLGYWRGYVWGPMAMLTYWGLREYDHVPAARQASRALVKQMNALMMSQWLENGYICENYGPHRQTKGCTGQAFYHWGALTGFLSLLDAGHYSERPTLSEMQPSLLI